MFVSAILLAAGASARFGSPKLLAPVDAGGTPLIRRVLNTWTSASFDEVILVVGSEAGALVGHCRDSSDAAAATAAADSRKSGGPNPPVKGARRAPLSGQRPLTGGFGPPMVRFVENPRWVSGMFSSVKSGLAALDTRSTHVAVSPADLPFLREESLRRVLAAAASLDERSLLVPIHGGRRGHPLVFAAALVPRILSWGDDRRLSSLFGEPDLRVLPLDGFGDDVLRDVDVPSDLVAARP